MPSPEQLAGPTGAIVLLVAVVGGLIRFLQLLWRNHLEADADDRRQRDEAFALAKDAIDGTRRMADAWEDRNRRDAARHRRGDS